MTGFGLTRLPRRRQRPVMAPLPGSTTAVPVGFALTRTAGPMPEILLAGGIDFVLTSTVDLGDRAVVVSTVREASATAAATARSPAPAIPSAASATVRVPFAQATAQQGVPVSRGTAGLGPVTSIAGLATWDRTARTPASTAPVGSDAVARAVLGRATSCRQSRTRDARSGFLQLGPRGVEFIDPRDHPYGLPLIGFDTGALSGSPSGDGSWT